jgi:hypothetical protein
LDRQLESSLLVSPELLRLQRGLSIAPCQLPGEVDHAGVFAELGQWLLDPEHHLVVRGGEGMFLRLWGDEDLVDDGLPRLLRDSPLLLRRRGAVGTAAGVLEVGPEPPLVDRIGDVPAVDRAGHALLARAHLQVGSPDEDDEADEGDDDNPEDGSRIVPQSL